MPDTVTHEGAIVPSSALTAVTDETDVATETSLHKPAAEKLLNIVQRRADNRGGRADMLVLLEEWAYESWSDIDVANQQVLVVSNLEDHSEKAYKASGAFEVQMDVLDAKTPREVDETTITSLVQQVDKTDEDFHDSKGELFLPKSAVEDILVVE